MKRFSTFLAAIIIAVITSGCVEWTNYTNLGPTELLTRMDDPRVAIIDQIKVVSSVPEVSRDAKNIRERALSLQYRPAQLLHEGKMDRAMARSISHELFRKNVTSVSGVSLVYGLSQAELDIVNSLWRDSESRTEIEYALLTGAMQDIFDKDSKDLPADLALLSQSGLSRGEVRIILKKRIDALMTPLIMISNLLLSDTMFARTMVVSTISDGIMQLRRKYDYAIFTEPGKQAEYGEWTRKLPWFSLGLIPSIRRWDYLFPLRILDCRRGGYQPYTMRCRRTQVVELLMFPAMFYMHEKLEGYHKVRAEQDYDDQIIELIFEDMSTREEHYVW